MITLREVLEKAQDVSSRRLQFNWNSSFDTNWYYIDDEYLHLFRSEQDDLPIINLKLSTVMKLIRKEGSESYFQICIENNNCTHRLKIFRLENIINLFPEKKESLFEF